MSYKGTPERIAVIGGSLSGKTEFVLNNIVPKYRYIHLFGAPHNYEAYQKRMPKYTRLKYHSCIAGLSTIKHSDAVQQLVILDDFVDTHFIRSDAGRQLFSESRHSNISVVLIAHAPNIVLTPFIKNSISMFVLCQYIPSKQFVDLIEEFWYPLLAQKMMNSSADPNTFMKQVRNKATTILNETFIYRYSKLILFTLERKWVTVIPENAVRQTDTYGIPKNNLLSMTTQIKKPKKSELLELDQLQEEPECQQEPESNDDS
jgi:hypothetical protein